MSDPKSDENKSLALYYAGVAAIVAGILVTWDDRTGDLATQYIYKWHEQLVRGNFEYLGVFKLMMACIGFRRKYHSAVTPLFSYAYTFTRAMSLGIATDLFFAQPQSTFQNMDTICAYTAVWALVNCDPTDTLFKATQNEHVWELLNIIGLSAGSGVCAKLDKYVDMCGGDEFAGLVALLVLNNVGAVMDAIEQKLSTGQSANTNFHETGWGWRYINMSILAYYFACFNDETSQHILALHPALGGEKVTNAKDKVIAILAWINIWNGVHSRVIGSEVGPSQFVTEPLKVFNGFHQPNKAVATKA